MHQEGRRQQRVFGNNERARQNVNERFFSILAKQIDRTDPVKN